MDDKKKPGAGSSGHEEQRNKDKNFIPIQRNCSLEKLTEKYIQSFTEFSDGFPDGIPTQFLLQVFDIFFKAMYLKTTKDGRQRWEI